MDYNETKITADSIGDGGTASGGAEEQEALRAQLNRVQEIAHIGDWEWEIATNAVSWSDELYRIYGYEPGEIPPDYGLVLRQMHPDSKDEFMKGIDAALKEDRHFEMEYGFYRKDGTEAHLHTIGKVTRDQDGSPLRMHGVVQDITARKAAEKRRKETEEKFQVVFERVMDGILIADVETKMFVEANSVVCNMLGYTREEILGLGIEKIHRPEDFPEVMGVIDRQLRKEIVLAPQIPVLRKDGSVFPADINAAIMTLDGRPCLVGIFRDVTERKRIEEALRESENLYRNLVETTTAIAWEVDIASLRFAYISPQVEKLTGYPPEAWTGFTFWAERIHPEDRDQAVTYCQTETAKGLDHTFEYRMSAADGSTLWIRDVVSVIKEQGRPVTLRGYFIDITASKVAAEKLRESEEFVRRILDTMDAGVISLDRDYRIGTANRAYCGQVGGSASEIIGKHCYEVSHRISRPCYEEGEECAVRQVFEDGEPHVALHHHIDSEGSVVYVETKAFPIKDSSGSVVSVVEMIVNITEKYLLEGERLKAQKLESIGTLAGGIAHDFNNLLQGVFGHISMARMSIDRKEESLDMLEQAEKALHQSVSLTNQLLTFAKGGKPVKGHVPILPLVEDAARFALSGSSCDYEVLPQGDLWQVNGDAGQIGQVIQNIALNADQSMPQGGEIKITVRNVFSDSEKPAALKKRDYVLIAIADNGPGIPGNIRERIFDPYFTTKERGSGLGLATSYSIVQNHGGTVSVESRPREGTTFTIYLPAIRQSPKEPPPVAAPVETRSAKVLVMDDEEMIRKIAGKLLRSLGHECEFAEKGESAVAMFKAARTGGRPFDLVILDLTIRGGMGGAETVGEMLAIDPKVKAIVSTGYSDDAALSDYRRQGFGLLLKKPYTVEELRDAINSVLA